MKRRARPSVRRIVPGPTPAELRAGRDAAAAAKASEEPFSPWAVAIIEGTAELLASALNQCEAHGEVLFVLPNGVNRWTIMTRLRPSSDFGVRPGHYT